MAASFARDSLRRNDEGRRVSVRPCLAQRHLPGRLASCLLVLTLITSNEPFIVFGVRCKVVSVSAFVFVKPAAEDCADRPETLSTTLLTGPLALWAQYYHGQSTTPSLVLPPLCPTLVSVGLPPLPWDTITRDHTTRAAILRVDHDMRGSPVAT